jgi:hypothetical protein
VQRLDQSFIENTTKERRNINIGSLIIGQSVGNNR